MDFGATEIAIATFLAAKINLPNVTVLANPDKDEDFERVFAKETIIVAFSDEEPLPDLKGLDMVYQESSATFAFLIQSNSLRTGNGKQGVYALHKLIKKFMIGYTPTNGQAFTYVGFKFLEKQNGTFQYAAYFKTKTFEAQHTDNDNEIKVNLNEITFK